MKEQFGIDIKNLDKFITTPRPEEAEWGSRLVAVSLPEFRLEKIEIKKGKSYLLETDAEWEVTVFVEEGEAAIGELLLKRHEIVSLSPNSKNSFAANKDCELYMFYGLPSDKENYLKKYQPTDQREKYWGDIQTIVSKKYTGKRIFVRSGQYPSLEFHCNKQESYFIHSGKLLLRLRAGRGEDRFFELTDGSAAVIRNGLMHQRGGLEDTVIIEISTKDEDSDSYLVEDGKKHVMPRLQTMIADSTIPTSKKVCFDVDGVLRTQTKGDYENAKPIKEAIELVNKLYDEGYRITLYTSSFMGRSKSDQREAYEVGYEFNKKQLQDMGVKYHELFMGKPPTDALVDDQAVFFNPDWDLIEKEIRSKLNDTNK